MTKGWHPELVQEQEVRNEKAQFNGKNFVAELLGGLNSQQVRYASVSVLVRNEWGH